MWFEVVRYFRLAHVLNMQYSKLGEWGRFLVQTIGIILFSWLVKHLHYA